MLNRDSPLPIKKALEDYLFLRNRQYPEKSALKLVGDRYRLTGTQRTILYRGVVSTTVAERRKKRIIPHLSDTGTTNIKSILVDGYNVLFTLMSYILGKQLFISNDGLLRDCGADYDRMKFDQAITLTTRFLAGIELSSTAIYLDSPVNGSRKHLKQLKDDLDNAGVEIQLVKSADQTMISNASDNHIIVTSDSGIIDAANSNSIYDAARHILEKNFQAEWLNLESYV